MTILDYRHFLTNECGRALLSYLPGKLCEPFSGHEYELTGNRMKALYLPRALNELGYVVDYIDWKDMTFRVSQKYDLFIGHGGYNFAYIDSQLPKETKRIYFSAGFYWEEFNNLEMKRFQGLYARRKVTLPMDREITTNEDYAVGHSHGIITLGNEVTARSYIERGFFDVYPIGGLSVQSEHNVEGKDFESGRAHFLFFSGDGNVHKGLDLLLEAFARTDKLHLHICQRMTAEFIKVYSEELRRPNIHVHGNVSLRGKEFNELVDQCDWIISASCCEACPSSVIECMQFGLVPVVTRNCSVDTDDFGVTMGEGIDSIYGTILQLSKMDGNEIKARSLLAQAKAYKDYSPAAFLEKFKRGVEAICQP